MNYKGRISSSKSLFNRALIVQSFFEELKINGFSNCEDVKHMQAALYQFQNKQTIFCGEAGTVIRFMALRASREEGEYFLTGSARLLTRPLVELKNILSQLGVSCRLEADGVKILSRGWLPPSAALRIDQSQSSQFVSAVILSGWQLPFDLELQIHGSLSQAYLQMTLQLCQSLGMEIVVDGSRLRIPKNQIIKKPQINLEPDYSSVAAVLAASVIGRNCELLDMPKSVYQPDYQFLGILRSMGAQVEHKDFVIRVQKSETLKPVQADLSSCPDLFPVLAVVCSAAQGTSRLFGAPHLKLKESNRIIKTAELLQKAGVECSIHEDGISVVGGVPKRESFTFDPENDHRMAMAAAILSLRGVPIKIKNPEVVQKSFPEFWDCIEGKNV